MTSKTKGSSLVITLLVLSAILISTLSIALVAVKDRQASIGSVNSSRAYQLADEGVEKVMQIIVYGNNNYINKTGENNLTDDLNMIDAFCDSATGLIRDNGEGYSVELFDRSDPKIKIDCDDSSRPILDIDTIKSVGYNKNTSRAISAPVSFLEKGLVAYWRLNEDSGSTAYDWVEGGGDNIGQLSSGASFTGNSVDIPDGDFVQIENLLNRPNPITLSAWVKLDSGGVYGSDVISLGNAVGIRVNNTYPSHPLSTLGFFKGSTFNVTSSGENLPTDEWHMVTYTVNNSPRAQKIYIDGAQKGSSTVSQSISYSGQGSDTYLGKNAYNGGTPNNFNNYNFKGEISEVRVYERVLSDDEILTLYNVSKP